MMPHVVQDVAVPLESNHIYQGDCVDLLNQTDKGSVNLVFADPPFNIGFEYDQYDDAKHADEYLHWCRQWIQGVYHVLKSNGTFWLAIGDEYAAELKIESQRIGFHCRSWVIWYYTFGVNCRNGFSRSHTHLFHFVKDPSDFVFNRLNPQIRIPSARQLVYADLRANPDGRLPDNTWIIRPQDAPSSFSPIHDTWYFARVAGTFKEREGFHGCQMPEQLLARIIRTSSRPQDLVLDPFGGSGTTLCVAKKLGRQWMGFELSTEYARYIDERLDRTQVGDPTDGPEDPIQSAPSTAHGKQRKRDADTALDKTVIESYQKVGKGFPVYSLLCDKELNQQFVAECDARGDRGIAFLWNRKLLQLRKAGRLRGSERWPRSLAANELECFGYASEVAWRLLAVDYQKTLDDLLCSPECAAEFDRLATEFSPPHIAGTSFEFRWAAVLMRKRMNRARMLAARQRDDWTSTRLHRISIDKCRDAKLAVPGVFVLCHDRYAIYAGSSEQIRDSIAGLLDNPRWQELRPDSILVAECHDEPATRSALTAMLVRREFPVLNCHLWVSTSELPRARTALRRGADKRPGNEPPSPVHRLLFEP